MKKVLVLGGGFAGVEASIYLKKYGFDVTLISNRDYLYIYPTSIWVPTNEVSFNDVCLSLSRLKEVHKFNLIIDEVVSINAKEGRVECKNNSFDEFDYLVVAVGSGKMRHPGIENTLSICGEPEISLKIKEKLDYLMYESQKSDKKFNLTFGFGGNPKDSSAVRGGPAFELMFNIDNYLKKEGVRDKFEITFFAPMPKPGARMGESALKMMDSFFNRLNIKKVVGKKIKEFVKDGVIFEDGSKLDSDLTMFIPAGYGHNIFKNSDLPLNEAGFVKINDYCQVEGDFKVPVFAIGDSAEILGPNWRAKQGHIAEVMAKNSAHNIKVLEEKQGEMKGYKEHLNILCVMDSGNGAAFVYRDDKRAKMIPMPIIGHWLKKGWGWYFKNSKLNKIPRIPGM